MLLSLTLRKLSASSALATLLCAVGASAAFAGSSVGPVALSDDGSTLLNETYDATAMQSVYTLTNVATGASTTITPTGNFTNLEVEAMSGDGKTVVGTYRSTSGQGYSAFVWTQDGSFVDLGNMGGASTYAEAVSADGTAVAGWGSILNYTAEGFYWTKATGKIGIGFLSGGDTSEAWAISADGKTVVGEADNAPLSSGGQYHAVMWNVGSQTLQNIDNLFTNSNARFVNDDGSVIAGTADSSTKIFRWTASTGMVDIGGLGLGNTSLAAMSADGSALVGKSETSDGYFHAYRYAGTTITDLGTIGGGTYSAASDVSADGSVVVGQSTDSSGDEHGFRWTEATGMQTVEEWLASKGISLGDETTASADFVSANGNVIVGETADNTTYIARVASPNSVGGTGIIDTSKFLPTVASANNVAVQYGVYSADTIMFGAQGEPMRNLLSAGQKSVWGTIDGGYDDSHISKGGLGLGEFGFGYGIADGVTARFAGGGTYTKQDLDVGGDVRQRGFYLSPEVSADLGRNVYLTVGGYWGHGSIDSHRGYLNGADRDYSDGSTNSETWAAKIRLDWLNAATISNTAITPYTALSFAHTKVDGFTENNGSFPVSYDATDDHATIARIGADFVHPLTDKVRLLAKAEADYQFEDHAAGTSGSILGVSDFNLDGQDLKHFWLRGGLGAEFDVGKASTASVMVNATTQGQDPNVWVRTNFTVKF